MSRSVTMKKKAECLRKWTPCMYNVMHRGCITGERNMTEEDGCVHDGLNLPPRVWGVCPWSDSVFTTVIPLCVIIISPARPHCLHACTTRPCSALSDPSQRSSPKNLKGFCKSNLRGNENTQTFFFFPLPPLNKTGGTEEKENPPTEMREFHKLPFVRK